MRACDPTHPSFVHLGYTLFLFSVFPLTMTAGKNMTDGLADDRVTPTKLHAFMKNLTELLTLNNTRPAAQLDGTERRISGVDDRLETLETRLPLAG